MSRFSQAIALIGSARKINAENTTGCVMLIKEFLRREALWANLLGLAKELPFVDLATNAKGAPRLETQHQQAINRFTYSVAEYRCCLAMLNWYGHSVSATVAAPLGVEDPYLPLMHFFRFGGYFSREHRVFIHINEREWIHSDVVQKGDLTTAFVDLDESQP
jgi:hypothetical protein